MRPAVSDLAAQAAVSVAGRLGVRCTDPAVLADGANAVVHLRPSPVVVKVAVSTLAVRTDVSAWLQRELDLAVFLDRAGGQLAPAVVTWAGKQAGTTPWAGQAVPRMLVDHEHLSPVRGEAEA